MTGPLAQQFAKVREGLARVVCTCESGTEDGGVDTYYIAALAALSAIERHVQDMETALRGLLVETEPEQHRGTEPHPERGACVWCDARAALPAREKGEE